MNGGISYAVYHDAGVKRSQHHYYIKTVSFVNNHGETIEKTISCDDKKMKVGDQVKIIYVPDDSNNTEVYMADYFNETLSGILERKRRKNDTIITSSWAENRRSSDPTEPPDY